MKTRSNSYIGTFKNTPEGNQEYKTFIRNMRIIIKGGRIYKMFRGGKRNTYSWTTKLKTGTTLKDGATHFDVYLSNTPTILIKKWLADRMYNK